MPFNEQHSMKEEKQIEFEKLRHAYIVVKKFLEKESGENIDSLETKIAEDLSLLGDDNYDMLVKFIKEFEIDFTDFEYDKHFLSEEEITDPTNSILKLLTLSLWLPLRTIELLTSNKIKMDKPSINFPDRKVSDMTFKDLLTSYIEGKYTKSENVKYIV